VAGRVVTRAAGRWENVGGVGTRSDEIPSSPSLQTLAASLERVVTRAAGQRKGRDGRM